MNRLVFLLILLTGVLSAHAQFAVKSNLLYDAATTPNLGIEVGVGGRSTFNLVYGLNPWSFKSETHGERKVKHWVLMPEYRWWPCARFNGHFIGVHAMGGQFNAANVNLPIPGFFFAGENLRSGVRDHRYQAAFAGAGFTYGYQWILGRHWNLEAEAGVGYAHAWYKKYACGECGGKIGDGGANYLGVTKLGISILYLF